MANERVEAKSAILTAIERYDLAVKAERAALEHDYEERLTMAHRGHLLLEQRLRAMTEERDRLAEELRQRA